MEGISGLQIATYILGLLFIVAFAWKANQYAKMPTHLRWELYPLAGETKRPWGGSYLEEPEWWNKPREEKSFLGEMKFMGEEILYFKEYFRLNRSLWYIVYPFHMGIFLFVVFFALLFVGALTMVGNIAVSADSANIWGQLVYYLTLVVGITSLVLGSLGCLALFIKKLVDKEMATYTRRIEYFNILFVLAIFLTGLFAWAFADSTFATARAHMRGFITLSGAGGLDAIIVTHITLLALFLAYLPFTNMMHFFAKFFTYHFVRWDDRPHLRGSKVERQVRPLLEQPVSWSAPHMQSIRLWSDAAQGDADIKITGHTARKGED